ncbi:MAG TPA: PAS domain-containing protein, partial [Acidimicrobiales bacterium]|nr:PAS domain-containing protein [Acidimicrobiales bacterium]
MRPVSTLTPSPAAAADAAAVTHAILEGVAEGIVVTLDGRVTANAAAREILGVPPGAEVRTAMFNPRTLDGEPYAVAPRALPGEAALASSDSGRFRIRVTALDGRELVIDGSVSAVSNGAVIVFRDVTDEHARAVLNDHYLYALFNSMPIPLTVGLARDRRVIDVNQAFLDLVGLERDQVVGVQPPYPWWEPSEDSAAGFDSGSRVRRTYRCADGRPFPVEVLSHG